MSGHLVVGADVGGTAVKYVVVDRDGVIVTRSSVASDPRDPAGTLARLAEAVAAGAGEGAAGIGAVGLACAGIVDAREGRLGRSPNLPAWEGLSLFDALRAAFGDVALAVANDVNAALFGEWRRGAGRGCRHLVMVAMGTGVGGGVLVDGELLTGAHFGAGEIGHIVLDLDGPLCACGNRGCLEAYAGQVALVRRARELVAAGAGGALADLVGRGDGELTALALFELAAGGDTATRELFAEAGERLGQALAGLVNVLDPDRIIVGGGLALAGDLILDPARRTIRRLVLAEASRQTPILPAALGPHAAALGAAALAGEAEV